MSSIDVTIMDRSANIALPSSYSKTLPALRAGAAVTRTAGLGGKRFVDFLEPHACVIALVLQHGSKCTPPRIEHRLCLSSLGEGGGIHVADEDGTTASHETGAQFVQEIFSAISHLRVNRSGALSFARPLRARQNGFETSIKTLGIDRRHTHVLVLHPQPQDPNSSGRITGYPYSIPRNCLIGPRKPSGQEGHAPHARLSPSDLKARVSLGEIA